MDLTSRYGFKLEGFFLLMPIIRKIEIQNFRSIRSLEWFPSAGFNCIIGSGDVGKTTILDAIDLCLGARRNASFTDADFHNLNVANPISVTVILGELEDSLKSIDAYGDFLRGFDAATGKLEEEPASGLETVLCLQLKVMQDLEPQWSLQSSRATLKGFERNLKWEDRERISPLRLGSAGDIHLAWKRGSLLTKLSEETPDTSEVLSSAARDARVAFGDTAKDQLKEAIDVVNETAKGLGIDVGSTAKAMLDVHSVSFGSGAISLHSDDGIPLKGMGTGSKRLLIAGIQRKSSKANSMALIDEIEIGLEPHRIIRFLKSLGSKDKKPSVQVFATSHSPTVLQELSSNQIFLLRRKPNEGELSILPLPANAQGVLRSAPNSFLAKSVIVCEGKTEIGFIRGIDLFRVEENNKESLDAAGVSLLDCDGGSEKRPFEKATVFLNLGYRVAIFIDNDREIPEAEAKAFKDNGGQLIHWLDGQSIEAAIILSATDDIVAAILESAEEVNDNDTEWLASKLASASNGNLSYNDANILAKSGSLDTERKEWIAKAAGGKKGWFKDVGRMEALARYVIAPNFKTFDKQFQSTVISILNWALK